MSRHILGQVAAAVVMSMTPFVYGTTLSFGGLLLAESSLAETARLTIGDAVMIAAASNFGRMAACLLSAPLTDRLGVLRVIQLGTPLNLLAWPLLALTAGRGTVLAGSVLAGSVVGLTGLPGRLYIAEVTDSKYRPFLCYFPGVALGLGLLISFSLSGLISEWRYAVLICGLVPSVVQVVGTILLPNSPRWLMNRGYADEQVRKSIVFYHGQTINVAAELKSIQQSLRGKHNLNIARQIHLIFTDWDVGKPCLLMFIQFTFETFCGGVVLTQFAQSVFQQAVQSLSPTNCTQILAGLQISALAGAGVLLQFFGRKTVLITAALLTGLGEVVVAAFFQFEDTLGSYQWLAVVGIVVANAASNGGISQLSHLMMGELLPTRVRQLTGSAISLYMGALSAIFIHLFPVLTAALGSAGLFAALAGVNVLQMVFAFLFMPETKGLSLEEVQVRHFSSRFKSWEAEQSKEQQAQQEQQPDIVIVQSANSSDSKVKMDPLDVKRTITRSLKGTYKKDISEGMVNAAYEDTETGLRHRKNSERVDADHISDEHTGQRQVSMPTSETQPDEEAASSNESGETGSQQQQQQQQQCVNDAKDNTSAPVA